MKKMLFCINPNAGHSGIRTHLLSVLQIFCASGFDVRVFTTSGPREITKIIAAEGQDYDLIVTGDLGQLGKEALLELARLDGLALGGKLTDCGTLVFDNTVQDVHAGGSGCGCSGIVLCGYLLNRLNTGKLKNILFCGTGALLSPTSTQQGLPIPGVCHAVWIQGGKE